MAQPYATAPKRTWPAGLSAKQRKLWKLIHDLLQKRPLSLVKWRQVGRLVQTYCTSGVKKKAAGTITALGKSFGCAHSELYYAQQLAQQYSPKELDDLQARDFGWGKMMLVLSIEDHRSRSEFIEKAIRSAWSATRLRAELHRLRGYSARPVSRPRKTLVYVGYEEGLQELIRQARNWQRYHDNVWQGQTTSMLSELAALPPEKMDRSLLELLQQAKGELRKVARACSELEEGLERALNRVVQVLTEGNK